ncbi:MAG: 30S ribosomal protein S24e [Candidatus Thermoplasmatota archaeon]|nr:30S ribosomal protein S24e [Candidatus Thermoplasmatota archaeon]
MELEIEEKNDNPILQRQEIQIVIKHENKSTPKRNDVIQSLVKELKAKKDLIIIDHLKNKYGKAETRGYAKIYSNIDALNRIETKPSIARQKPSEKKTQKAKEPKKEEKDESPKEEKPVEKSAEEETPSKEEKAE